MTDVYGGIEGGGTKFVCFIGSGPDDIRAEERLATGENSAETLDQVCTFFRDWISKNVALAAIGIGSFGPLDINPESASYGHILSTVKPGWSHVDIAGTIGAALSLPVHIDTDVNAAALGEHRWGAAQDVDNFVYVTVGTGIGGGVMVDGRLIHGLMHPEIGHMYVPQDAADTYPGICSFHGNCLEGLASGPAVEARLGGSARDAAPDDPVWDPVAGYLAHMCVNLTVTLSPQRIILGGGLMQVPHLLPKIRERFTALLNGYIQVREVEEGLEQYIVAAGLGRRAGAYGALALAAQQDA